LKNEIKKDVERTYQEFEFFNHKKIIHILTNVLFIWSKENSEISYRQGMNEVAASLIYVYFREALYKE
jgi:TBC1 domain family protein 5